MSVRRLCLLLVLLVARPSFGQQARQPAQPQAPRPAQPPPKQEESQASESLVVINQKHYIRLGSVELKFADGSSVDADQVELFEDEHRAIATGNVVLAQGSDRIAAERAEFDTQTRLGTFYHANGMATLKPPKPQPPRPGAVALPPVVGQETVVLFFGETVEKIGAKKYKITKGGFTTCVQPTPRWGMHADTVILNIEHYTLMRNAVMTVKGVPMLYLPIMLYPTKRGDRATGFLIPAYGSSTLKGQSIHDAFFWAIDRSQDATFFHDYFSTTGQGVGSEYRYNYGPGESGNVRAYVLDQHAANYAQPDGSVQTLPASHDYEIRGNATQLLPFNLRAQATVNYFSSIQTSQTFNTNIYDSSRDTRSFGGNLVGAWGGYTMNATVNHTEYFSGLTTSALSGTGPQIDFNRSERPLFGSDVYFSLATEYANLLRESHSQTVDPTTGATTNVDVNAGLSRFDLTPQIRYPFKKWQWFTVNSTVSWRDTYYTRSYLVDPATGTQTTDPATGQYVMQDAAVNRRYYSVQTQIIGPVFNRIWDTPDNGYAERFKHSIEPNLSIQHTSSIDNFNQIVQTDGVDSIVGGGTQFTYGVNNRFYAKRKLTPGQPGQAREILDVELTQTAYTNPAAAGYDTSYQTSALGNTAPSHYSPIALNVRALPTTDINATVRAEFDSRYHSLRTISANGSYSWTKRVQTTIGWSKRGFIPQVPGFNDPTQQDQFINTQTTVRTTDNHVGITYSNNYDVLHSSMVQQQITGFYNSQCCGVAFQYQTYNYGVGSSSPIPSDHRFFLSFTLAGVGNFSPFNGAMGGVPR
jgi:LPS-assembly protein